MASATKFYEFKPLDKKGEAYDFAQLQGKVVLIVNTASKCGFTPQFKGLEKLYKEIKATDKGDQFEILGFPCNQFGNQDPGSNDDIQSFCQVNYGVSFPVLGKSDVNGAQANPVFEWLKSEKPGILGLKRIKWNFEKFLVGKDGQVKNRWASTSSPSRLKASILTELGAGPKEVAQAEAEGQKAEAAEAKADEAAPAPAATPAAEPAAPAAAAETPAPEKTA